MELLRIVAMLLVVVVHTDFWALGEPTKELIETHLDKAIAQYFVEAIAIICVNCFIFISGWFSIKPSVKGFCNLLFTIFFYNILVYFCFVVVGRIDFSWVGFLLHANVFSHWFIVSYLGLYLLSPILNSYVAHYQGKAWSVLWLVLLDVVFGWLKDYLHFEGGYSLIHFMTIYIVARYIHARGGKIFELDKKYDMLISLSIAILTTVIMLLSYVVSERLWAHMGRLFLYNSPLVIIQSIFFSLFFTKLKFKSLFVNFVGASVFSVYLLHSDNLVNEGVLRRYCLSFWNNYDLIGYSLIITSSIALFFVVSILIDQVRKLLWNSLNKQLS